jgi:alpha-L-fucosidase
MYQRKKWIGLKMPNWVFLFTGGFILSDGISESWSFFNNYINHDNYIKQLNGFTAKDYKPKEWAKLIKEAGAKYTVITTKHHDGISMWNTKADKAITTLRDAAANRM